MRMPIRMRFPGQQTGEKIAIGKRGVVGKTNDYQLLRRDDVEPLFSGAHGADEIARSAGIKLISIAGGQQVGDRLVTRAVLRRVEPKTEAIGGVRDMANEELIETETGPGVIERVPGPHDGIAKFRPLLG